VDGRCAFEGGFRFFPQSLAFVRILLAGFHSGAAPATLI